MGGTQDLGLGLDFGHGLDSIIREKRLQVQNTASYTLASKVQDMQHSDEGN
jgi:hypothetical protein